MWTVIGATACSRSACSSGSHAVVGPLDTMSRLCLVLVWVTGCGVAFCEPLFVAVMLGGPLFWATGRGVSVHELIAVAALFLSSGSHEASTVWKLQVC